MHSPHAAFIFREMHRQDLLSFAEQQRLVKLACVGKPYPRPHAATPHAVLTFAHRLSAYIPFFAPGRQPASSSSTSTAPDSQAPFIVP